LSENKQSKIDENFVKNKYDSMCGLPVKTKFMFYNVNMDSYVGALKQLDAQVSERIGESYKYTNHHYDRDETLGNFLVRLAQMSQKNSNLNQPETMQHEPEGQAAVGSKVHSLFCGSKACKYPVYKHVQAFYHKDGFL
jgi:hypothetical protein